MIVFIYTYEHTDVKTHPTNLIYGTNFYNGRYLYMLSSFQLLAIIQYITSYDEIIHNSIWTNWRIRRKNQNKHYSITEQNLGYDSPHMINAYINGTSIALPNNTMRNKFKYCLEMLNGYFLHSSLFWMTSVIVLKWTTLTNI